MTFERELELTVERLRHLSPARLEPAREVVYEVLEAMTERDVPRLQSHAWGDQLRLIGRDVSDQQAFMPVLRDLRRRFDLTL